jgi:predicted nucleic acid-binding protein
MYLTNSPQLGAQASIAFDEADNDQAIIYLPAIVAAELYFLNKNLSGHRFQQRDDGFISSGAIRFCALYSECALEFDADSAVGEMHDRIIAGVARRINATLLTRDFQITSSGVVATVC